MLTLQIYIFEIYECMPSYKSNRVKWNSLHRFGYQHISPLTHTIGISSHRIHISSLSLHSTPQNRIWKGKNHVNIKSINIKVKTTRSLTQLFYFFRMSLRATNSSSSQRYKEKLLALEIDPDIEMFTTQKRSSTSQVTANQKKAKGKSNSGLKRPPFWLGFQALNWTNRGKGLPMDSHLPVATLVKNGMREKEARECQTVEISFPFVI
jgi:hypothetical protein